MDPTEAFFADLIEHPHEPLLAKVTGSIRIDVRGEGRSEGWRLLIDHGNLKISQEQEADCYVLADWELFGRIVTGRSSATAAVLQGKMQVEGDLELLLMFQRLLTRSESLRALQTAAGEESRPTGECA
jgi:putative sterol carrier protein